MAQQSEYQKREAEKHRRKIILPCVIPWEYGTNKYASQKGSGGFGSIRNATTKIQCSRPLSESNDGVVPRISCPSLWDKELASQAGLTPFGGIREHAIKVQDREGEPKKDINKLSKDHKSESILKIWSRPNPHANATQQIGRPRNAVMETVGGRRFSQQEINACRAAIPKFQDPRETVAAKAHKFGDVRSSGLHSNRQTVTVVEGLNRSLENELDSNRYSAWLGGQLTLQSQSRTGGFQKVRDVVSTSYYDRVMSERQQSLRPRSKVESFQNDKNDKDDNSEAICNSISALVMKEEN